MIKKERLNKFSVEEVEVKPSRKIWKKWWFWVIVVIIIVGTGMVGSRADKVRTNIKSNNPNITITEELENKEKPSQKKTTTKPSQKTTTEPSQKKTTTEPSQKKTTTKPSQKKTTTKPSQKKTTKKKF